MIAQATLEKVTGGAAVRTSAVTGNVLRPPVIGDVFIMAAAPLDPSAHGRLVSTSPIRAIRPIDGGVEFDTENSTYRVTYLPDGAQ